MNAARHLGGGDSERAFRAKPAVIERKHPVPESLKAARERARRGAK